MVIKELGLVFTELGRPFVLRSDNGPWYSSREFHNFLSFYQVDHITSSPHYPQSNGFAEALVGITKKLMEKSVKEGKPWNYGLLQYRTTPISSTLPSPLEMLTGRRPHSSLPQLPHSIGKNMETSRIHQELLRRQPNNTTSTGAMELEPGQPVFVKEVNGNIWRTATVDQPAAEPHSYWVRFPDNSILRRTRSMIKPRSLPSHFELQAEAQQRNFEGETNSHSCASFNQLNEKSMLPVTPMASVTNPATVDRGSKVGETPDPINSTGAPQPTGYRGAICSTPSTPRHSTRSTKRCSSSSLYSIQEVNGLVTFHVCKLCSGNRTHSVSVFQYRLVKHELCGLLLTFSVYSKFYSSDIIKANTIYTWFGKLKYFNFKQGRMILYEVAFL